ncbi:MAG: hypothetical protein H9872_04165 [Candidatus Cellulosilyticum pullistercoris]|uniref:Uncharacterized protein n=1 Tax=Candidatus Cellulosilyticum pullistercoris TaxID=2838521 RepID=A0A9E2KAA4_9FIRM|nr:hypothetical protein [Candidatus Cellulosilyticum pullistercoris]
MKSKIILAILCICLIVAGGATAYYCFDLGEAPDYSSGMFVDRGESDGYATSYNLLTCL